MIGIILAGGLATRLGGGDKGQLHVGGVPILDRVVAIMRTQCDQIVLNANGDAARFARFDCPVVADTIADLRTGRAGPLAGVLAGLDWAAAQEPDEPCAVTAPTDTPFLPGDLVARLRAARANDGAAIVCARSGGMVHPVAALWPIVLRHNLREALANEGPRKVRLYQARHGVAYADWPIEPYDPFFNTNTPDDLIAAEAIARRCP